MNKRTVIILLSLTPQIFCADSVESPKDTDATSMPYTWGIQPVFAARYNSLLGVEGDIGFIAGMHRSENSTGNKHLYGSTFGLAASIDASYAGFMYGLGLGAGACVQGGGAASCRIEYIRLDPWRDTRGLASDEAYEGMRLTISAAGGAGGISFSAAYIRNTDDRDDHALAFGIGVGM